MFKTQQFDRKMAKRFLELVDLGLPTGLGNGTPGNMCIEACVCNVLGLPNGDNAEACVDQVVRRFKIALNDKKQWSSKKARAAGMRRAGLAQTGSAGTIDSKKFLKILAEQTIRVIVPFALRAAADRQQIQLHKDALNKAADDCELLGSRESALKASKVAVAANATAAAYAAYAADAAAADAAAAYAADAAADAYAAVAAAAYAAAATDAADAYAAVAAADAATAAYASADAADAAYAAYAYATAATAAAAAAEIKDYILSVSAEICVQALIECKSPGTKWLKLAPLKLPKCPKGIKPYIVE